MAEFDGVSELAKSGPRRLRDAEELLEPPSSYPDEQGVETRHLRGAAYLAGYGVECLLKVYIILARRPECRRLSQAREALRQGGNDVRDICGASGHDLPYLLSLTDLEGRMDKNCLRQMPLCAKWKSSWRYDPRPMKRSDAEAIVHSARQLVNWIQSQI